MFDVTDIVRDTVIVVWTGFILISLIYKSANDPSKPGTQKQTSKYSAFVFLVSFCIGYALNTVSILSGYSIFRALLFLCINIGGIALYCLIFSRLYHAYKGSIYSISTTILYFHFLILITSEILFITQSIFDYRDLYPLDTIFAGVALFIFMIGLFHLIYCFNRNLFLLVLSQNNRGFQHDSLSRQQINMIHVIVQQTLIGSIMVFALFTFVFVYLGIALLDPQKKYYALVEIRTWSIAVVICILSLCVHLSFRINKFVYYKCCGICDKKCNGLCEWLAAKNVKPTKTQNVVKKSISFQMTELEYQKTGGDSD